MAIFWDSKQQQRQQYSRIISTIILAIVTLGVLYWSPLWMMPSPAGAAMTLLIYLSMGFGVLVWALRRIPIQTRRDALPLGPLMVVILYLGLVAGAMYPMLTMIGSYDVDCTTSSENALVCTGYESQTDEQWQLEAQRAGDLPLMWVTARDFD